MCDEIMEFLGSRKIPWVSKCKSNRVLVPKGQKLHTEELGFILAKGKFRCHGQYDDIEYVPSVVELPSHGG